MKCDFCDKKATVFLTQLVEGQMKKVCLCDPCAKERGVTDPTGFSLADLLLGGAAAGKGTVTPAKTQVAAPGGGRKCPNCGFTLEDLRRVRRFGCSDCYTTFGEDVGHMVRGMHKGISHIGKVPAGLMAMQVLHQRLEELRSRLDQAISSESYEEAAGIRDEIRNIELGAKV
ncbi:MAG: UvrB/UvrC motif-containing protein [Luteolibacter sp.]|jgi:protein arginine kinase activator|nr:UvrB/UvrC motif-containing protein [Luteolibacter sp.]